MRHGAVAAQIAVPGVVFPVDAALGHIAVQHREPLLALAAADDLVDEAHRRTMQLIEEDNRIRSQNNGADILGSFFQGLGSVPSAAPAPSYRPTYTAPAPAPRRPAPSGGSSVNCSGPGTCATQ